MDEFQGLGDFGMAGKFIAQPVFHGFHIMVGGGFYGLDCERISFTKIFIKRVKLCDGCHGEWREFGNVSLCAEHLEPFDFNQYTKTNQAKLAEVSAQGIHLAMVASIERGEGGEFGKCSHD